MIGCYNINDIMINGVDLENCTPIIQVLPSVFEADEDPKLEGTWFSAQVCPPTTHSC